MFHIASKIFWLLAQPLSLTIILVFVSMVALFVRWRRTAFVFGTAGGLVLFLSAWTTLGALMLGPLEDRFARPAAIPEAITGVIALGGGFEGSVNRARGGYELNSSGDRFVETAVLARRYPEALIVISGGGGSLLAEGEADADTALRLLEALGVGRERIVQESRSRNTHENAVFTRELIEPDAGDTWLLVTSAFHMPRAMDLFRRAGFDPIAWPTDYRTTGQEGIGLTQDNMQDSVQRTALAIREWLGLAAYRFMGRTSSIFPAP